MEKSLLFANCCGEGKDAAGRTLDSVIAQDDPWLERTHDYIQWLFPLLTPSSSVPDAQQLKVEEIAYWRGDDRVRENCARAFDRMMQFYGMQYTCDSQADDEVEDCASVDAGPYCSSRSRIWLTPRNHNYQRLTRILISLQLRGQNVRAIAVYEFLEHLYRIRGGFIGQSTWEHWRKAATGPS
jgi:hypothetical protein